ncbi:hypothetical protein HYZ06_01235 [Candidatus Daviesbacteria bacterium]|nr:hypothetical protein [Candidatus Daviesbacteria bacterium]
MRNEHELRRIAGIPGTNADSEELQEFINGTRLSQHEKDLLMQLCNKAIDESGEFGIVEGIRYALGGDSEYVEYFKKQHQLDETSGTIDPMRGSLGIGEPL